MQEEYAMDDTKGLADDAKGATEHIEHVDGRVPDQRHRQSTLDAIQAEKKEHKQTMWNAIKSNRQAVWWSIIVSMCVVMESYDLQLVGNLMAQPAFKRQFGEYVVSEDEYLVSAPWQTALNQAGTIGSFFGILLCGYLVEPLGYKKTTILGLGAMILAVFITFFAKSPTALLVGEIACGVPWGFFINVAPAYASEIAPLKLRGILTIYVQICWCIGSFICAGILYAFNQGTTQWAYRIPFGLQWIWPVPLIALIVFAPESPYWLCRKGKLDEAEKTVTRLGGSEYSNPAQTIALIVRTNELEMQTTAGASYIDCFRGTDLRRTIIISCMFAYQNFSGLLIGNQSTYFFQQAGIPTESAFALSLGNTAIQFTAVLFCWVLVTYFGRRTLYLWGVGFNILLLLATGIASTVGKTTSSKWIQAVFVILIYAQYGLTIGPITYAVIAETSSIRLRAKSVGIARNFYYIVAITTGILNTYMLNPTAWNMKGKVAFVWAGTACFVWVTAYFHLPECKDRSYRELDILFHRKIPARSFCTTKVEDGDEN